MAMNAARQPKWVASTPPAAMPSTEPNMPAAVKAPVRVARMAGGKRLRMMASPTLP
ncbi:hypothetical protein D3C76_1339100 [compost metagenome]